MPKDVLVTTPKSESSNSKKEAEECIQNNGGFYFRYFSKKPQYLENGSRVFYVDNGYIRGYATVEDIQTGKQMCETTGKSWPYGFYAFMPANSWKWIKPIEHKGFQGFRYFDPENIEIVGNWKDPMPKIEKE